jgi:hypothetical protein
MAPGDHLAALEDGQPWTNREALALLGAISLSLRLENALPSPAAAAPTGGFATDVPDHVGALLGLLVVGRILRSVLPTPGPATPSRAVPRDLGDILR